MSSCPSLSAATRRAPLNARDHTILKHVCPDETSNYYCTSFSVSVSRNLARTSNKDTCASICPLSTAMKAMPVCRCSRNPGWVPSSAARSRVPHDALLGPPTEGLVDHRLHMIFAFNMLVPSEFVRLLEARHPEALIVFGFYALLLHHGSTKWQIGNSGTHILRIVLDLLGTEWHHWLEYPRRAVLGELT